MTNVDQDTGFTPKQQQNRWNQLFNSKLVKPKKTNTEPKPKKKVGQRQPKSNNTLKLQAIELYRTGKTVKEVSEDLGITYANANYYKKFAV
jgi:hypothetical protein